MNTALSASHRVCIKQSSVLLVRVDRPAVLGPGTVGKRDRLVSVVVDAAYECSRSQARSGPTSNAAAFECVQRGCHCNCHNFPLVFSDLVINYYYFHRDRCQRARASGATSEPARHRVPVRSAGCHNTPPSLSFRAAVIMTFTGVAATCAAASP